MTRRDRFYMLRRSRRRRRNRALAMAIQVDKRNVLTGRYPNPGWNR